MSKKYDLALAMTTYFNPHCKVPVGYRRKLYNDCIDSLTKVDWLNMNVLLVLRDDCSDEPPCSEILSHELSLDVDFKRQEKNLREDGNIFANCQEAAIIASEQAHWVLWLDSDSLVKPNAIRKLFDLVHMFPNHPAYGGFNSPLHETYEVKDGVAYKKSLTELGTLFRGIKSFQGGMWAQLCSANGVLQWPSFWPCTAPSVIQHTGKIGVNNPDGNDFDKDF